MTDENTPKPIETSETDAPEVVVTVEDSAPVAPVEVAPVDAVPEVAVEAEAVNVEPKPDAPAAPEKAPAAPAGPLLDGRLDERAGTLDDGEPVVHEGMNWFVLRVASNKESYVRDTLLRKIQIEGMDHLVKRILVPTEKTKTIKGGRQRITETKLYPGYVFVEMRLEDDGRIPQDVFFLIKETTGVGDFVGATGRPTPLAIHEIEKMLLDSRKPEELPTVRMVYQKGDPVTIKEGPFENYEGSVDELIPEKGLVRVLVTIFGRQAPIELEEWQIAKAGEE